MPANDTSIRLYKPGTGWGMAPGGEPHPEENTGLSIMNVVIGEYTDENGDTQYITETIYEDVMRDIYEHQNEYSCYPALNAIPQVFIIQKGTIIIHNGEMELLISLMKDALAAEDEQLLEKALYECVSPVRRKMSEKFSLNQLNANVSSKLQAPIQMEFLCAYLRNYYIDKYTANPSAAYVNSLEPDELLKLCCEMNNFYMKGEYSGENMQKTADELGISIKELFNIVRRDVYLRFITGRLTGAKGGMK